MSDRARGSPAPAAARAARHPGSEVLLAARGVRKSFAVADRELEVLHGVDLDLRRGELLALMGPSGAGKSTLLHILGLLDRPSEGSVLLEGASAWELSTLERARLRNRKIGFVFQFYHLLPELDALENVVLPAMIAESRLTFMRRRHEHYGKARELLERFGLAARVRHRPAQLSGGERQRVALARALFHDPPILIADEPTGNLDSGTGERVLELIFAEQASRGISLLLVTHDERLAARCQRQLYMDDGQIQADSGLRVPE
jgi:lipoprotein-releasing system ATP-binding protein